VSFCINPWCPSRENGERERVCAACGTALFINNRFHLIRPIVDLTRDHPIEVFEALDTKGSYLCEPNTVKILKVLKSSDQLLVKMFQREAETLQLLNHPALPFVDIEDVFSLRPNGLPFDLQCLAMSKIEGVTLEQWIRDHGPLNQNLAIQFLREICEVLHYVHCEGFFHRDIKPQNIMVRPDNSIALIDFGGVRQATDTYTMKLSLYRDMTRLHTMSFSPPEQIDGRAVPQSDFYALGRTFIFALTAKEFYEMSYDKAGKLLWRQHAKQIDRPLLDFIDRLVERSVAQRPQSTQAILDYLNKTLPRRLKFYQVVRSKIFKFGCVAFSIFLAILGYNIYQIQLAEGQAKRVQEQVVQSQKALDLGSQLYSQRSDAAARREFEKSIRLHPNYDAYLRLGGLCHQINDSKCETENYDSAIKLDPNNWQAYFSYAGYYEDSNLPDKYEKAKKYYEGALTRNKTEPSLISNNLARLFIRERHVDKALRLVEEGLSKTQQPYYKAVLFKNQGWIYLIKKEYNDAERSLLSSIALEKNLTSSHCLLAQVQDALHKPSESQWTKCLRIRSEDSSSPEVEEWTKAYLKSLHR
jgi:serine/threonine protein kinase